MKKIVKWVILLTGFMISIYNLYLFYEDYKTQRVLAYAEQLYKEDKKKC